MLIFNIWKIRKLYKEAKENPGKVAGEELVGAMMGVVLLPVIIFGLVLALLFVLGFTPLIYKSFLMAKILFYILLPIYLLVLLFAWRILKRIKREAESLTNGAVDKVRS